MLYFWNNMSTWWVCRCRWIFISLVQIWIIFITGRVIILLPIDRETMRVTLSFWMTLSSINNCWRSSLRQSTLTLLVSSEYLFFSCIGFCKFSHVSSTRYPKFLTLRNWFGKLYIDLANTWLANMWMSCKLLV